MIEQQGFYDTKEKISYWSINQLQHAYPETSFTDDISSIGIENIKPLTILYFSDNKYEPDELKHIFFGDPIEINGKLTLTQEQRNLTKDEENSLKLNKEFTIKNYLREVEEEYETAIGYQRKIDNFVYLTDKEKEELNNQIDEAQIFFDEADNNNYEESNNNEWNKRRTNLLTLKRVLDQETILDELNKLLEYANEIGVPEEIEVYKKSLEDLQKQDKWYANNPIPTPPTINKGFRE